MAAIQSCGVGPAGLFRPIGVLGVAIVALLVWLSFWAIPGAAARAQEIRVEALREAQFGALEPGRFRTFGGGNVVFYAERIDDNRILHNVNVFIDRTDEPGSEGKMEVWVATRAEQRGAGQAEQTFILYDGRRYEGVPGSGEFRVIQFAEGGIPIRLGELTGAKSKAELKSTRALLQSSEPADIAELQARISSPLLALVLMVLAVPLARLRPRQGRFARIGIAILAYFVYSLVLDAARTWVESGVVAPFIGIWWVHAIALCVGLWLLVRESPPGRPRAVAVPA
jgi:lipopolysaccharide export system permease protein